MTDAVNAVALSPDGTKLAGAGKDGLVKIWTAADGKELFSLAGHAGPVLGVAFAANGQLLVSSGADKTLRFWNPANGQAAGVIGATPARRRPSPSARPATSPSAAATTASSSSGRCRRDAGTALAAPHGDAVTALALSADGASILTGSADKTVRLSTAANGQQVRVFPGATAAVTSVSLGGNLVAAGTADQHLLAVERRRRPRSSATARPTAAPSPASPSTPAGTQLLTAGGDGLLKLWAMPAAPTRVLTHPDAVASAAVSADGKHVFTAGADKIVRSWDPTKPQQPERQFPGHPTAVGAVAVSPNGQVLASAGDDGIIRFWNQTNGQQAETIGAHDGAVTSLSFAPNSQQLVSASADGSVKVWQLPAAAPKLFAHPDKVTAAVLSPDGTKLLTGCADKQARLWNLATGAMERAFPGPTLAVTCVAFSTNGAHGRGRQRGQVADRVDGGRRQGGQAVPASAGRGAGRGLQPGRQVRRRRPGRQQHPYFRSGNGQGCQDAGRPRRPGDGAGLHGQGRTGVRFGGQDGAGVGRGQGHVEAEDGHRRRGDEPRPDEGRRAAS